MGAKKRAGRTSIKRSDTTKILVLPDIHAPYHDRVGVKVAVNAIYAWKPHRIIFIGDVFDCLSVSFHSKNPSQRISLKHEITAGNRVLDSIEAAAKEVGVKEVDVLEGNHEFRLTRYLQDKAPELFGLVDMRDLMRIDARGWRWTPYRQSLKVGKIHFAHDVGRCGKHTAVQSLADYGHSIIMGHSHRAATIYGGTVAGERQVAMNVGTLIDVNTVDYRHKAMAAREWQKGFGLVHMIADGTGWCTFCPIIKGRAVVDGLVVRS